MRPGWLSVPAAHRDRPGGTHAFDDGCGHGERSGLVGTSSSSDLGADGPDVPTCVDPVTSGGPGIRVVLVQLDSEGSSLSFSCEGPARVALHNLPAVVRRRHDLEDDTDPGIEILRLRACSETRSGGFAPDNRWICGAHPSCRAIRRLDKHRLDVALSAGRHAAERAKLAGVAHLIGVAPSVRPAIEWWLRRTDASAPDAPDAAHERPCLDRCPSGSALCFDPYDALRCRGRPEIAALVGVAIAAAQMGIPFSLPDPAGGVAADAAFGLNPGVRAWLDPIPVDSPGSIPFPARARRLCTV